MSRDGDHSTQRRLISSGSPFERTAGYSCAVVHGDWCFVSGTTGYDYATMVMPETVEAQTRNCLKTIEAALLEAGFTLSDTVRCHYYITDALFADAVFPILGEAFGELGMALQGAAGVAMHLGGGEQAVHLAEQVIERNQATGTTQHEALVLLAIANLQVGDIDQATAAIEHEHAAGRDAALIATLVAP